MSSLTAQVQMNVSMISSCVAQNPHFCCLRPLCSGCQITCVVFLPVCLLSESLEPEELRRFWRTQRAKNQRNHANQRTALNPSVPFESSGSNRREWHVNWGKRAVGLSRSRVRGSRLSSNSDGMTWWVEKVNLYLDHIPRRLQVPSENVFGVGFEGPNTFCGCTWSPKVCTFHKLPVQAPPTRMSACPPRSIFE